MNFKKTFFLVSKISITSLIINYILSDVNIPNLISQISIVATKWYILVIFVGLVQTYISAIRWIEVSKILNLDFSKNCAIKYTFLGQFFNQLLPTSIGGDAARIWLASEDGNPLRRVTTSVICDRIVGMAVVFFIGLLAIIFMPEPMRSRIIGFPNIIIISLIFQLLALIFFYYGNSLSDRLIKIKFIKTAGLLLRDMWLVFFSGFRSLRVIIFSALIQLMIIVSVYIFGFGLNAGLTFSSAVFLVPIIMLVAMVPISFAGWGVREASMVLGLSLAGVSATNALAISIMFGFTQVILGFPGGILWLKRSVNNEKKIPR